MKNNSLKFCVISFFVTVANTVFGYNFVTLLYVNLMEIKCKLFCKYKCTRSKVFVEITFLQIAENLSQKLLQVSFSKDAGSRQSERT